MAERRYERIEDGDCENKLFLTVPSNQIEQIEDVLEIITQYCLGYSDFIERKYLDILNQFRFNYDFELSLVVFRTGFVLGKTQKLKDKTIIEILTIGDPIKLLTNCSRTFHYLYQYDVFSVLRVITL